MNDVECVTEMEKPEAGGDFAHALVVPYQAPKASHSGNTALDNLTLGQKRQGSSDWWKLDDFQAYREGLRGLGRLTDLVVGRPRPAVRRRLHHPLPNGGQWVLAAAIGLPDQAARGVEHFMQLMPALPGIQEKQH